jgi:phosphatidylethanolamine/phosphatidyl-N-methylethanolamine N-methyltransferase
MKNSWNSLIYKWWAPVYERFFNTGMFLKAREQVFNDIRLKEGSKVLFVGVGTGADLPYFLNKGYEITAIDFSSDMLHVAMGKYQDASIRFLKMDAQKLEFEDESFDFIVASLILSVVPQPKQALSEMVRVLKKNRSFFVFDKFVPKDHKRNIKQIVLRPIIKLLGTDIGLDFYELFKTVVHQSEITKDEDVMMSGLYRKIMGVKKESTSKSTNFYMFHV